MDNCLTRKSAPSLSILCPLILPPRTKEQEEEKERQRDKQNIPSLHRHSKQGKLQGMQLEACCIRSRPSWYIDTVASH